MLLQFNKSEIELTLSQPLLELIELVSNSYTLKEYEDSKFNPLKFYGNGINDWGEFNKTTTPTEWLSIYKYSKEYGNWSSTSKSCNPSWKGNILDFGAGSGTPWINIHPGMTLYLLEANLFLANGLKETYSTYSNVKVINSLKEVSNIKFDYIYSKDVLEHVRYIRQLEVNNICSSCSNSWVKKQMDYRNKFGDPAKKSNEDNKRKYARKKLREEENEKNFR